MRTLRMIFLTVCVGCLAGGAGVLAEGEPRAHSEAVVFAQEEGTAHSRAVFAQFLAVIPGDDPKISVDCALSISNVCAGPGVLAPFLGSGPMVPGRDDRGRVTLFLYDMDGTPVTYTTEGHASPGDQLGEGLNPDGTLGPGQTWTVRLAEVLARAQGKPESEVRFRGYAWILSEFDCLAGTYSNTIFGLGFTQSYEMVPAMGQGGFFGGVPIF